MSIFTITEKDFTAEELKVIDAITYNPKEYIIQMAQTDVRGFVNTKYEQKVQSTKVQSFVDQVAALDSELSVRVSTPPEEK
jgi:hypothetical protein